MFLVRIASQSADQLFYFAPDGLLGRYDYRMEPLATRMLPTIRTTTTCSTELAFPHYVGLSDAHRMRNPAGACFVGAGYQARHCRVAGVNPVGTQSREDTSTMVDNAERSIALVVEDDPWIRLLLTGLLTDEGYAVLEASNGSAALRLAQRQPPALVLLDLILPEQSGLELLAVLKSTRATAHVPVIAVSARTDLLARVRRNSPMP